MRRSRTSGVAIDLVLGLALVSAGGLAAGLGCDKKDRSEETAKDEIPLMAIDDVAARIASGTARAVDANGEQLRKDIGVIPGAVLLSDYEAFSLSELPEDKSTPLVFYCANEQCDASHVAAKRARTAGWERVHVLAAGIIGWSRAGRDVDKPATL